MHLHASMIVENEFMLEQTLTSHVIPGSAWPCTMYDPGNTVSSHVDSSQDYGNVCSYFMTLESEHHRISECSVF